MLNHRIRVCLAFRERRIDRDVLEIYRQSQVVVSHLNSITGTESTLRIYQYWL
jgi:hypothetical protein